MEVIELKASGSGSFKIGISQDPTEITNASDSYRITVEMFGDNKDEPQGKIIEVVRDGVWTPVNLETMMTLGTTLIQSNPRAFDMARLREEEVFYLTVLESIQGNPFEGIESPMEEIGKIIDVPNPSIEESDFIQNYAIFFLRHYHEEVKRDPDYPEKYAAAMRRWKEQVALHSIDVDVVNTTSQGKEVLFTLPARISNSDIFDPEKGQKIEEITYEAAFIGQTDPKGADQYIAKNLIGKLKDNTKELSQQNLKAIYALDDIRERYNIPRWLEKPREETKATSEDVEEDDADSWGSFD